MAVQCGLGLLPSGRARNSPDHSPHLGVVRCDLSFTRREETDIDKDRLKGSAKQAKGAIKKAVGKMTGDAKLQSEGKADNAAGKVQNAVGGLKNAVREANRH